MVRGYVYHPQGADALQDLFIYFAGRGEDVRATAKALHWLPDGFGFAAVNYRGVADSEGHPSEVASVQDASQFANHLRRAFPHARLHVVGRSLGTGVAVQLVARQDFSSLQLVTPYDSMLEVAKRRFPLVPLSLLLRHQFNSLAHCREVAAKTQVLLAERDDVVLPERSEKLIAAWPTPICVQTVPVSDHHNIMGLEATWLHLVDFALTAVLPEAACGASRFTSGRRDSHAPCCVIPDRDRARVPSPRSADPAGRHQRCPSKLSAHHQAAIDEQHLTRHEAAPIGGEKQHGAGNVLGPCDSPQRGCGDQ